MDKVYKGNNTKKKKELPGNNCFRMINCSTFAPFGTVLKSARIYSLCNLTPNNWAAVKRLLTSVWEVLISNIGSDVDYPTRQVSYHNTLLYVYIYSNKYMVMSRDQNAG